MKNEEYAKERLGNKLTTQKRMGLRLSLLPTPAPVRTTCSATPPKSFPRSNPTPVGIVR